MTTCDRLYKLLREFSYVMDLAIEKDAAKLAQLEPEFRSLVKAHVAESVKPGGDTSSTSTILRNNSLVHEVIRSVYHGKDHITKDVMASGRNVSPPFPPPIPQELDFFEVGKIPGKDCNYSVA